jgi:hypothetical protein
MREFRPIINRQQIIRHGLVRELMNERCNHIYRPIRNNQRRPSPSHITFLRHKQQNHRLVTAHSRFRKLVDIPQNRDYLFYVPPNYSEP